jgi:hypothetical protein
MGSNARSTRFNDFAERSFRLLHLPCRQHIPKHQKTALGKLVELLS